MDGPELSRLLRETTVALRRYGPLIGAAGQPGYLVVILLRQDDAGLEFGENWTPANGDAPSRDWQAGRKFLTAHRDFLRQEVRAMRKRTFRQRLKKAAYAFVADQPAVLFVALLVLVLGVALWRSFAGPH